MLLPNFHKSISELFWDMHAFLGVFVVFRDVAKISIRWDHVDGRRVLLGYIKEKKLMKCVCQPVT